MQGTRQQHETAHFRIVYPQGSAVEGNLAALSSRLERARGVMSELLALAEGMVGPITVQLDDLIEDPQNPGTPLAGGGYALPRRLTIYEVYRPDAPAVTLERSLLLVLLGQFAGEQRPWPPLLVYGLLAWAMRRLGGFLPDEQVRQSLAAALAQEELPAVGALLTTATPDSAIRGTDYLASISFVAFLIDRQGVDQLREFLRRLGSADVEAAAREAFGHPLDELVERWHATLRLDEPSAAGIGRLLRQSLAYLRPYRREVAEIVIYLTLSVGFAIGVARMQGLLLDLALIPRDYRALATIMGILVVAFIVVSLAALRESYLTAWVGEGVLKDLRRRMHARVQALEPAFFEKTTTGDILSRMTSDLAAVDFALTGALAAGVRIVLTLILAIATIILQDWRLAIVALIGTPLFYLVNRFLGPRAANASLVLQERQAESMSLLQENLGAQPVVKAFGLERRMIDDYGVTLERLFRSALRLTFVSGIYGLSANSIATAIELTVLGVGAYLVMGDSITTGTLFTFVALMAQIIGPIQNLSGWVQVLQQATGAMDRIEEVIDARPVIADAPDARAIGPLAGSLTFEGVTFGYDPAAPILQGLNLRVPAGATVAFVGPSGCGKSTALNQILRFYDPQAGRIAIDGVDLRAATLASLRGQIGVVLQENLLFNLSVRENIRLGRLDATDAEVEAAARAAEIHEVIVGLPQGYDTPVGERGGRLSGGQRQRVAIARAIVRNPALLLLDEATSALDPHTEAAINATLARLAHGRTTISVTHRLASIVGYDQIYVFDHGQIVEQGTHEALVAGGGLYAKLWRDQGGGLTAGRARAVETARLAAVPLLAGLGPEALGSLASQLFLERFAAGDLIVQEGDVGDKLYLIQGGAVEVLATDPSGRQRPVASLHEGDYFGEIALLYDLPRTASIRARTPAQLYSLSKIDLNDLLTAVPHLRALLERGIIERAQEAGQTRAH